MRGYLYLLAGITSALIGWNIGQIFLADFGFLPQMPEIVLFPCVAISLAFGMIINEILISNPTRLTLCLRKMQIPLLIALGLGSIFGLAAGGLAQILFAPQIDISPQLVRIISWVMIGASVGLAEGTTWRYQSVEAGDPKRFWQRFTTSVVGASVASLLAAFLFEWLRGFFRDSPEALATFRNIEDPLGFSLLGLLLGLAFTLTNSPSYLAALRAGTGFEFTGAEYYDEDDEDDEDGITPLVSNVPVIEQPLLRFVSNSYSKIIEEGLSIQLPGKGKIVIGSEDNPKAQIRLPNAPKHIAHLNLQGRKAVLLPNAKFFRRIAINGERLGSRDPRVLNHNDVLTFYTKPQDGTYDEKIYRFVYYNRFLDPQA
ncbi:hypothetical protein FLX56_26040 [Synechococcus moorigangaii CMS01]|nr:hypothetical protein [Synechococcus moorigangaii CMS01]